jgi:beta-glucosidase
MPKKRKLKNYQNLFLSTKKNVKGRAQAFLRFKTKKILQPHLSKKINLVVVALLLLGSGGFLYLSILQRGEPLLPPPADALYRQSNQPVEARVQDLLSRMTLDEKIGQMALVDKNSVIKLSDVGKYNLGGVLSGAGEKPASNIPSGWLTMVSSYKEASAESRLGIPLLYGADANHGNGNVPGAVIFPHFIGLGATGDADLVRQVASATAQETTSVGINWSYSPTLDAPTDIRWGRVYEAFSDDPSLISKLGAAYIEGLQSHSDKSSPAMLATAKHYIGAGSMVWGSSSNKKFKIDQGSTPANGDLLQTNYLPPFQSASESGVASVMIGLNNWGNSTVVTNKSLITDTLKGKIGFKGFVVSDWYGVYEVPGSKYEATVKAINAGVDMVMLPFDYKKFERDVHTAVDKGDIKLSRINDAVGRILGQKFQAGIFDTPVKTSADFSKLGSSEHRQLARLAVAKSSVLLKNNDGLLPLSKNIKHILVAGSAADNVGQQCGAWTVEWQGIDGNWLPGGTSILQGIRQQVSASTTVSYDKEANFQPSSGIADIGVAVVGERPYAEGFGDNPNPSLDANDLLAIQRLKSKSKKVVVVIISGRPLIITSELPKWDAAVASWLPGTEGEGIADVLFGNQPFTGRLPLPWPASIKQLPIQLSGKSSDGTTTLFPRYFGLSAKR